MLFFKDGSTFQDDARVSLLRQGPILEKFQIYDMLTSICWCFVNLMLYGEERKHHKKSELSIKLIWAYSYDEIRSSKDITRDADPDPK